MNTNASAPITPPEPSDAGHSGQPIRSLQYMLNQLAIHNDVLTRLAVDGIFGERTLEAVMLFQREFFPPVTGQVDNATWDAIVRLYRQSCRSLAEHYVQIVQCAGPALYGKEHPTHQYHQPSVQPPHQRGQGV